MLDPLLISLIGGIISLDITACWQVMISRPIVIGPVVGILCGDLTLGLSLGVIMELLWINTLPLGASIPVDAAATTVVAVAIAAYVRQWDHTLLSGAIVLGILFALPFGAVFKRLDIFTRRYNNKLVYVADTLAKKGALTQIQLLVLVAILLIFLKYFLFYFICIRAGIYFFRTLLPAIPSLLLAGLGQAHVLLIALGLAVVFDTFKLRKTGREHES